MSKLHILLIVNLIYIIIDLMVVYQQVYHFLFQVMSMKQHKILLIIILIVKQLYKKPKVDIFQKFLHINLQKIVIMKHYMIMINIYKFNQILLILLMSNNVLKIKHY